MKVEYMQGSNVVSISPIRARLNFPAIGCIEAYWEGLRDGRVMPARAEIDPRGIADVLEYAFVLERIAPGLARIRLAGMHLNDLMAMEVRGMPLTAMLLPEARREMQRVLDTVMTTPAAVRLSLASDTGFGRKPLEAQMILLPIRDSEGHATRIFGALQARGEIGRAPRRFAIRDIETKPLMGDAPLDESRAHAFVRERHDAPALQGMSERARPFAPRTRALAEQMQRLQRGDVDHAGDGSTPKLRLVHDADHQVDA